MSTPDSDGDRPAKRLGRKLRKLREARISAGYRSQPLVAVAIIYTLFGVAGSSVALSAGTGGRP